MSEEKSNNKNPFTLPSDNDVFRVRERERQEKKRQRNLKKNAKIWEKTTQSSRLGRTLPVKGHQKSPLKEPNSKDEPPEYLPHRRDMENMSDFLAKKREMFLVQMSLDTKKEEIRKLEEQAKLKEEALTQSEKTLEEDAIRFDTFLKQNDKKSHEAIKRAEAETKKKQEKMQEIKKVKQKIQMVQTEMSKLKETLDLCEEYKSFLDSLTPEEWFERIKRKSAERKETRRVERWKAKLEEWKKSEAQKQQEEDIFADGNDNEEKEKEVGVSSSEKQKSNAPKLEDEPEPSDSESEDAMYFKEPDQLLDIFTNLEETNLFLIQNAQETEQTLEELKQEYAETKALMDSRTSALRSSIEEHEAQISREEVKTKTLRT